MKPVDTAEPTWAESTWADDGGQTQAGKASVQGTDSRALAGQRRDRALTRRIAHLPRDVSLMSNSSTPLDALYARFDSIAEGRAQGDSTRVHHAILERLAANRLVAEAHGWTSCALERVAGMGRLRLHGIPPAGDGRAIVPDCAPRTG